MTLGLSSALCGTPDSSISHSGPVFTTKVDWFKPPPKGLDPASATKLPYQLTVSVPAALRQEAGILLEEVEALLLTNEQVTRFGVTIDADAILRARIDEVAEKLRFFAEHPVDEKLLRRFGKRAFDDMKMRRLTIMNDLQAELTQTGQLEHRLKPYLIRAVVLQSGGTFSASVVGKDLIVRFDAMGSYAVPMERCPVIAFLPTKPRHVYTSVGMMQ